MQLAHQRMGEIGAQNLGLLEEIAVLKAIVESPNLPLDDRQVRCEQELRDTKDRCSLLEDQIAALRGAPAVNEACSGTVNELFQNEQNLRLEVENDHNRNAPGSPGKNANCNDAMLEEIAELKAELQLARANATALNEERRQLEMKLSSLGSTEGELVNRLQAQRQGKQHEVHSLRSRIEGLQDDGTNTKSELGLSLGHGEDRRDAVTGTAPQVRYNEVEQRELEQLREANFAAQEWMATAVEHHQQLFDQVAELEADKEKLTKELEIAKSRERIPVPDSGRMETADDEHRRGDADAFASASTLQAAGNDVETELRRLQIELSARNADVQSLEVRLCSPNELEVELEMLRKAKISLDDNFENQKLTICDLQARVVALTDERNQKTTEMEKMISQLADLELWKAAAQERLNSLDLESDRAEEQPLLTVSLRTEKKKLESLVENLTSENRNLSEQMDALVCLSNEVAGLKAELEEQEVLVNFSQANLHNARSELEETKKQNVVITKELQGRLIRVHGPCCSPTNEHIATDTVAELEGNVVEMKNALDNQKMEAIETAEAWKQQCEGLKVEIATLKSQISDQCLEGSVTLESKISSLESLLEAELKEVDMLSSRCNELSDVVDELTKQNAALSEEKQLAETKVQATSDILENERELNESLSMQIEVMEKELSSTKLRILEVSQEREDTIASLKREIDIQTATIADHEAQARLLALNLDDLRSDMDRLCASKNTEVEIVQGTRKDWSLSMC